MRIFTFRHRKVMLCLLSAGCLLFNATANAQNKSVKHTTKISRSGGGNTVLKPGPDPAGPPPPSSGPVGINAGIQLWLDGSDVNGDGTTPLTGTPVTTWKDKSGTNNNATVESEQNPALFFPNQINGKSVLRFTGLLDFYGSVYRTPVNIRPEANPDVTVFTVYRQGLLNGRNQAPWGADNGDWDRFFISSLGGSINGVAALGPAPPFAASVSGSGISGETRLLTSVYDGNVYDDYNSGPVNSSAIYFNGRLVTSFTDKTHATNQQSNFYIGWDGDNSSFTGDIAEVIVYNRKLSDCEISSINKYLANKYAQDFNYNSIAISGSTTICAGTTTKLMASDANGYQWLLNDAAITGATSNSYDAATAGDYKVVINTINGCADTSDAITIIVLPSPDATITANGPASFCPGGQVQLSAMADANAYQWYMDGTAIPFENNQNYIASQSGTYTVKVSMANGCSAITPAGSAAVVVQYPFPNPGITADGPTNLCEGNSVQLSVTSPAASYQWHKDDAVINGATAQTYTAVESGKYWVLVTTAEGCYSGNSEFGKKVTVKPFLKVDVSIRAVQAQACPTSSLTLLASAQNPGSNPEFSWTVNNVPVNGNDSLFTYDSFQLGDSVTVTLTSNADGCLLNSPALSNTFYNRLSAASDCDGDGIPNGVEIPSGLTGPDTDGDGVPDYADTDSDNDGIADSTEKGASGLQPVDTDGDGTADYLDTDSDNDGIADSIEIGVTSTPVDTDGDGIANYLDTDSDNDGISDSIEKGIALAPADTDADGAADYVDKDSDNDGVSDAVEKGATAVPVDTDGDGTPDYRDLDSDADSLSDTYEKGPGATPLDTDDDGTADFRDTDSDNDGMTDTQEKGPDALSPLDSDSDGKPDHLDMDSDNDTIPDSIENKVGDVYAVDTDGDGKADYLDLDSDNDSISDNVEKRTSGNTAMDTDNDGVYDFRDLDSDDDGMTDTLEKGTDAANPVDSDSDGKPDYVDTDSDNDGIFDTVEKGPDSALPIDTDGDGIRDYQDTDSDNDGLSDTIEKGSSGMNPKDTDNDGKPDYRDTDSDNDGLSDTIETADDCDRDGTPNYMDTDKCNVGIYMADAFTPNGDGQNDVITPVIPGIEIFKQFKVYNRWGNLVFQTNTANQGWDGRFKGQMQPQDTYIWTAEGLDRNGNKIIGKGVLTLIR